MAKKSSDADSDVSSEGDGYLSSQEEDHESDSFALLDGEIFWPFHLQYLSLSAWYCCFDVACFFSHPLPQTLRSLSKDVFEQRTSTESDAFSLSICIDDYNKFLLLNFFTLIETICLKIWAQPLPKNSGKKFTSGLCASLKNAFAYLK